MFLLHIQYLNSLQFLLVLTMHQGNASLAAILDFDWSMSMSYKTHSCTVTEGPSWYTKENYGG